MKPRFAWSLPAAARLLAPMRRWSGIEVCEAPPLVWCRVGHLEDEQWEHLRRVPGADRFTVLDDGQLIPAGALVPRGSLPEGAWRPLADWLSFTLPLAGELDVALSPVALRLVRTSNVREPTWLVVSLDAWSAYARVAPQIRLGCWAFVADDRRRVIVRGIPLPPLAGRPFVEQDGIAVPAGWSWSPNLPTDVLREAFCLAEGESVLWESEAAAQHIGARDWVRATRGAVRRTFAGRLS